MSVLNTNKNDHTKAKMFLDSEELGMQRFDTLKYRAFDKLTDKQLGFFWRPEEVDILRDASDFRSCFHDQLTPRHHTHSHRQNPYALVDIQIHQKFLMN